MNKNIKMKYHLCCNQFKGVWEVRNSKEEVIFSGSFQEATNYLKSLTN